ncbi:MAG: response regulator transcription factor [Planctomycetes bacterium]|nr:response regulator transcription factor [Planctomycetota bacterium]
MSTAASPRRETGERVALARILLVEDEPDIAEVIRLTLSREGYEIIWASDGDTALARLADGDIDLVLLDILLPGIDGHDVCRQIRGDSSLRHLPVIMLTSLTEETDMVVGLGVGADDYVRKPFSAPELLARVRAHLRRAMMGETGSGEGDMLRAGDLVIDARRHVCSLRGETVPLTLAEFRLLHFLMANQERAFTRHELLPKVVGEGVYVIDRNIDVHVRNVRKKIADYARCIVTVRGVGYRFEHDGENGDS